MNWYELTEEERIKQIYSKYKIKDLWEWWQGKNNFTMEVRIKDFELIKQTARTFTLPYSASGVFVNNDIDLKKVILYVRDKATVWFGINPRKRSVDKWGKKTFSGKDSNVDNIHFIFIDIDRVTKNGFATNEDLEKAYKLAQLVLERLKQNGWGNNYSLICSGNGVQLLIRLDYPIILQNLTFKTATSHDGKVLYYAIPNFQFDKLKKVISEGIGKDIKKFCDSFKDSLGMEIDKTGFNIGRVGALPFTKNYKYDGFRWRGIIEMKNGVNEGLTDYIMSKLNDIKMFKENGAFTKTKALEEEYKLKNGGEFFKNPLVKFMMENDFPNGGINNTLWFSLKLLIRDSKVDIHSKEFIEFHNFICNKHKRTFTINIPEDKFTFDERVINNYCINNLMPLVYPLKNKGQKVFDMYIEDIIFDSYKMISEEIMLNKETTILEDINEWKTKLIEHNLTHNSTVIAKFIKGCIKKYGIERTKYYYVTLFQVLFSIG
jgi:hypothetical protein